MFTQLQKSFQNEFRKKKMNNNINIWYCIWYCSDHFGSQTELNQVPHTMNISSCSLLSWNLFKKNQLPFCSNNRKTRWYEYGPILACDLYESRRHLTAQRRNISFNGELSSHLLECTQILLSIRCSIKALETFKHWLGWKRPFLLLLPGCTHL